MALAAACGLQPKASSVTNVCRNADRSSVLVEGYLRLPISTDVVVREPVKTEDHVLIIVENVNGAGAFVSTSVSTTKTNEPNKMAVLPTSYTYNDLHIYTNSGKQITTDERVSITGHITKESTTCVIEVNKIETP